MSLSTPGRLQLLSYPAVRNSWRILCSYTISHTPYAYHLLAQNSFILSIRCSSRTSSFGCGQRLLQSVRDPGDIVVHTVDLQDAEPFCHPHLSSMREKPTSPRQQQSILFYILILLVAGKVFRFHSYAIFLLESLQKCTVISSLRYRKVRIEFSLIIVYGAYVSDYLSHCGFRIGHCGNWFIGRL